MTFYFHRLLGGSLDLPKRLPFSLVPVLEMVISAEDSLAAYCLSGFVTQMH